MIEVEPSRIVRPYIGEEKNITKYSGDETPEDKFHRIVATNRIDIVRYSEATETHPDMKEHFDILIARSGKSIVQWAIYFHYQYGVDTGVIPEVRITNPVQYAGTESPEVQEVIIPNLRMAGLPA